MIESPFQHFGWNTVVVIEADLRHSLTILYFYDLFGPNLRLILNIFIHWSTKVGHGGSGLVRLCKTRDETRFDSFLVVGVGHKNDTRILS